MQTYKVGADISAFKPPASPHSLIFLNGMLVAESADYDLVGGCLQMRLDYIKPNDRITVVTIG
jgi:hypothetical protein